jgi:branched-chain amino acid transport system ATP-binding protein
MSAAKMVVGTAGPALAGLQVRGLVKHFGGVQAVKGVDFDVAPGECVALIGPNGAGKSTCFACIAGQQAPTRGEVIWNRQRIDTWRAPQRLRAGVARSFQVAQTFEALTVRQNIQLALSARGPLSAWRTLGNLHRAAAQALLAQVGLADAAELEVLGLPYGAKKRLELAIALAGISAGSGDLAESAEPAESAESGEAAAPPRLLLLDEPAAGLAGPERAGLMRLVRALAHGGISVLYTEHNMDAVFGVADRVLVLIDGLLVANGPPEEVARHAEVRRRYLGTSFEAGAFETRSVPAGAAHA